MSDFHPNLPSASTHYKRLDAAGVLIYVGSSRGLLTGFFFPAFSWK